MNDVLKQRLIGILILVALGVVFWPIIFVEPGAGPGGEDVHIPPRPHVDNSPIEPPDTAGLRRPPPLGEQPETEVSPPPQEPEVQPKEAAAPPEPAAEAAARTRSEAPEKPTLDQQGIPVAWVLQVASVSEAERADELRDQLLAMGYKAYVKKVHSGDKSLYRVCVGPKVEKARLEAIRQTVDARFGVQSLVVRYYP